MELIEAPIQKMSIALSHFYRKAEVFSKGSLALKEVDGSVYWNQIL